VNVEKILEDLRREHDRLVEAIQSIERLALGTGKRRGRPPAWMSRNRNEDTLTSEPETDKEVTSKGSKRKPRSKKSPPSEKP
jgi:hypothetical protein